MVGGGKGCHGPVTKSLDLDVPTLLLSPLNSVFPCKYPSPSAAFILKVFLSFNFCFWSYFFLLSFFFLFLFLFCFLLSLS